MNRQRWRRYDRRLVLVTALATAIVTAVFGGVTGAGARAQAAPQNTAKPTISGAAQEGQTLTAQPGTWTGTEPITFGYQWIRCDAQGASCADIAAATSQTYQVQSADIGKTLRVVVSAKNAEGMQTATSDATAVVVSATAGPQNTAKPTISGTPQVGQTLTGSNGTWTGAQPITFRYQWLQCDTNGASCTAIASATAQTYTVQAADAGHRLRVAVTAANAAGQTSSTSDATLVVPAVAPAAPQNTAAPSISGTPKVGQTLTASNGTWTGAVTFAYQWQRCDAGGNACTAIAGATGQSYTLADADANHTIRVVVTATNTGGSTPATSAATTLVAPAGPEGQIKLPGGAISIPVTSVSLPERLVIDKVQFSPNPIRSRSTTIVARFRVSDTRGFLVRDALVFARSVPLWTSTPPETATATNGWVTLRMKPNRLLPLGRGSLVVFVRARKAGDPALAGVSTSRLVQAAIR